MNTPTPTTSTKSVQSSKMKKELADIIDGKVVGGLNNACPTFRITYRNEIYIKADNKEEAEKIFRNMSRSELNEGSEFVEIVSNEKED